MASLLFFLFNRPFVACACGSRLLVLFAKIVICPERSNHSALFSCRPASMGCTSLSGRSLSEAFRLLCGCRIVAVVSRAEFVPSGGDIRFFPMGRTSLPEGTKIIYDRCTTGKHFRKKGRRGRTCPQRPFSGGAFVDLSGSEVQILPRMRSMTQLVGVALTELQAQMERPRRWSTMSRRRGRCLCSGLSTRRVSSPSSVCRWMGA